jgi:hypothetical protein
VLPTFYDAAVATTLESKLDALAADLASGDGAAATAEITAIRTELQPGVAHPADVAGIEHVLDMITAAL